MTSGAWYRRPLTSAVFLLALLAYVPAFTAAVGRMPADSKLYLYLDPGRFLGDAASTFDARQLAGWVPHQHVGYLWPSGPWFWWFELIGVPDWIAHRLWIGTLMVVAGLGVRWCARLLGLGASAALAAAVVYQLSLYLLPYVSRTSVMLLPWAGLGWIVAFTIRASYRRTWGDPAAIALVVLTVGAVNATALAMIVPAPLLWLVHVAWQRIVTWRDTIVVALRVGVLSLAASVWWIAMLLIQGRHGTDVLPYSESLADVSLTSTSAETWRALGYWLFYVRDPYAATTTESLRYLSSTASIALSYLLPLVALGALVWCRWAHRRYAALLIASGLVLAVGVHPIADRSPLMRLLAGNDDEGLALALRSSTRALPVVMLGFALAAAMAVEASGGIRLVRSRSVAAAVVIVLAVANLPALWTGGFVDPALERDQDPPAAWTAASAALDESSRGARVLQLPGAEFGAYRWGYTVDQPLPGLTEKPLITRDLLPLGSAGAMDLLFALDDRVQQGVLDPEALAPVARLLGVDTVWLTNDAAFDRFRTARPEVVRDQVIRSPGTDDAEPFGTPFVNRPDVPVTDERTVGDPRVGQPMVPVELVPMTEPGSVIRAAAERLVVSGSGDGLVDAAAVGLLPVRGVALQYSAHFDDVADVLDGSVGLVVTDSNRDRARQWRSSQDTTGYTEPGGPAQDVLRASASDARLDVFDTDDPATQTVAVQRGPVMATATAYGEPFAYLPEHRPFMAVDGDPETSWSVGEHADPVGETLRLEFAEPVERVVLHQRRDPGRRSITEVSYVAAAPTGERSGTVDLDDRSRSGEGQVLEFGAPVTRVDLTIEGVAGGVPFTGSAVAGVGFAEVDAGLGPTVEVVRPPHDALRVLPDSAPLALTFARLRADPMNRWRADPEPELVREFELPSEREFDVGYTVRVDPRASDDELASLFGWPVTASTHLTGSPRHAGVAAFDDDPDTAWITAFDSALGATITTSSTEQIERLEVDQPVGGFSRVTAVSVRSGDQVRDVTVVPDVAGRAVAAIDPPLPPGDVVATITDIEPVVTIDRRYADPVTVPAALSELRFDGRPLVAPLGTAVTAIDCTPIAMVDGRLLTASIEVAGSAWLDGAAVAAQPCEPTITLDGGTHEIRSAPVLPLTLDQITLDDGVRAEVGELAPPPVTEVLDQQRFERTVRIDGCADGCWLVVGEGHGEAWAASVEGTSLGPPVPVDGGFNGWWVDPSAAPIVVDVRWTAQRGLDVALLVTALAAAVALALVVRDHRSGPGLRAPSVGVPEWSLPAEPIPISTAWWAAAAWATLAAILVGPVWALWGALGGLAVVVSRRPRLPELTALASLTVVAVYVVVRERRLAPLPNGGWPSTFESVHELGMFAIVCVLVGALVARDASDVMLPPGPDSVEPESDEPVDHEAVATAAESAAFDA